MTTDKLKELALAAKAAEARYALGDPERGDTDALYTLQDASTPDAIEALYRERDDLLKERGTWDRRVAYDELKAREYENRATQQRHIDELTIRAEAAEAALASVQEEVARLMEAVSEAHFTICYRYQECVAEDPPMYGPSAEWRVWHLHPDARVQMTSNDQHLYDTLMKLKPKETPNER